MADTYRVPSASLICILVTGCDSSIGVGAAVVRMLALVSCSFALWKFLFLLVCSEQHFEETVEKLWPPRDGEFLKKLGETWLRVESSVQLIKPWIYQDYQTTEKSKASRQQTEQHRWYSKFARHNELGRDMLTPELVFIGRWMGCGHTIEASRHAMNTLNSKN